MRITRRTVAGGIAALAVFPAATVLAAPSASAEPAPSTRTRHSRSPSELSPAPRHSWSATSC